ncbi:hypothetical protein [Altererythrobacter sp. Root672]|uniref:hypothetical protein n=1 Tax=Altererythrobacter sp. Root672 TaxID=1736584 RepID=UPI0006FFE09F|nr:hypothetical protein [Altererythrobacter sp. Root672]KRA83111.1 hypothetical protein ASD76_03295 [Altererythrobacter sp. Root672]
MQDEAYMRQWNEHHMALSQGVDRLVARIRERFARRPTTIDTAYARRSPARRDHQTSQTTQALLSGLAAAVITAVIFTGGVATVTAPQPVFPGLVQAEVTAPELA